LTTEAADALAGQSEFLSSWAWVIQDTLLPHSSASIPQILFEGSNINLFHTCVLLLAFGFVKSYHCVLFHPGAVKELSFLIPNGCDYTAMRYQSSWTFSDAFTQL